MFSSLLVATDFSRHASDAIDRAALLAGEHRTKLGLLHVINASALASLRDLFSPEAKTATLREEAQQLLHEVAASIANRSGTKPDCVVRVGRVLDEVLTESATADLLVLGARGLNRVRDLFLGTTSERLLRKSRRPILVVKQPAQQGYRQVLVPVDFSEHSVAALRMAMLIAPQAQIAVVHAFDFPGEGTRWLAGVSDDKIASHRTRMQQQACREMDSLLHQLGDGARRVRRVVQQGDALPLILDQEATLGADLIVMGKHGHSVIEELFLGGVTHDTLTDSKADVLIVHGDPFADD